MSVLAVVLQEWEAEAIVRWAFRFAAAKGTPLHVLVEAQGRVEEEPVEVSVKTAAGLPRDPATQAALRAVSTCLAANPDATTKITVWRGQAQDRHRLILRQVSRCDASLLLVAKHQSSRSDEADAGLARSLFRTAPCTTMLLRPGETVSPRCERILIPVAGGSNARHGLVLARDCTERLGGVAVPLFVEPDAEDEAQAVGEKMLGRMMRRFGVAAAEGRVEPRVVVHDHPAEAIAAVAEEGFDLVMIGSSSVGTLRKSLFGTIPDRLLAGHPATSIAVIRGPRPMGERIRERMEGWFNQVVPQMAREDRVALYESLETSARWNFDFFALMGLSTAIAALGLIQDSGAVVIGAMLVAPLMSPLLGSGLALVQGNLPLIRAGMKAILLGFLTALAVGAILGLLPGTLITEQLLARGGPTLLDMGIALLSGMAAAYCVGRPNLSAALPGVAIAAALVPPIATTGIALSIGVPAVARGAALLFGTNVVAIVLGAAMAFYAGGVRPYRSPTSKQPWVRHAFLGLLLCAGLMAIPLGSVLVSRWSAMEGRFSESGPLYASLKEAVEAWPEGRLLAFDVLEREEAIDVVLITESAGEPAESVLAAMADEAAGLVGGPVRLRHEHHRLTLIRGVPPP